MITLDRLVAMTPNKTKGNIFTTHPKEAGMNYFEHQLFALKLAFRAFSMSLASIIHAFFPFLFVTYTSRTISELHHIFEKRNGERSKTDKDFD